MLQSQKEPSHQQTQGKTKSQIANSTTLSEGNSQVDEQFQVKKGEKFQFINQDAKDWPQWSLNQKNEKKNQNISQKLLKQMEKEEDEETKKKLQNKVDQIAQIEQNLRYYQYYDRGLEYVRHRDLKEVQDVNEVGNSQKKWLGARVVDKIKRLFK